MSFEGTLNKRGVFRVYTALGDVPVHLWSASLFQQGITVLHKLGYGKKKSARCQRHEYTKWISFRFNLIIPILSS